MILQVYVFEENFKLCVSFLERIDQCRGKSSRLTKIEEKILSGVFKNMTLQVYVFAVLLKFLILQKQPSSINLYQKIKFLSS